MVSARSAGAAASRGIGPLADRTNRTNRTGTGKGRTVPAPARRRPGGKDAVSSLPEEVINTLFTNLAPREVVRSAGVSQSWGRITKSPELWAVFRRLIPLPKQLRILEKIVERRSKGKLFKCALLGTNETVLLRTIHLDTTNAGKD